MRGIFCLILSILVLMSFTNTGYSQATQQKWGNVKKIDISKEEAQVTLECAEYPSFERYYFSFFAPNDVILKGVQNLIEIKKEDFLNIEYYITDSKVIATEIEVVREPDHKKEEKQKMETVDRQIDNIWQAIDKINKEIEILKKGR